MTDTSPDQGPWPDAVRAALILSLDPAAFGGASVRGPAGPIRDAWLDLLRAAMAPGTALRRMPLGISQGRLLGGLDLAATLRAGRPVAERGLLAEAHGGIVVVAMAERVAPETAAQLCAALDTGEVAVARDGVEARSQARIGAVLLDEGIEPDEVPPPALIERMAFRIDLTHLRRIGDEGPDWDADALDSARLALPAVQAGDDIVQALCATSLALGIASLRAPCLALRVARAAAALDGRAEVSMEDAALAARLVLAPRATRIPADEEQEESPPPPDPPEEQQAEQPEQERTEAQQDPGDVVLEAAKAAIPAGLLALLMGGVPPRARAGGGRTASQKARGQRGRPAGVRRAVLGPNVRLDLVETLRAASPWQKLRRRTAPDTPPGRVHVRPDDFHVTRYRARTQTTTIFAVDASGSAAAARLAETKGAVELLLAECYVRRDQVAVVSFRGTRAEVLLPPTRSLVRAKRGLAGLPGGGGTPLAAGLDMTVELADALRRRGGVAKIVILTDGRANVARDGSGGRERAQAEALQSAARFRTSALPVLVVDTSARPGQASAVLAQAMGGRYLPLPYADSARLARAAQAMPTPTPG